MTACLEYTDVSRRFGDTCAVDHISLTVNHGDVFGLLGPNGAGKTTLMRMAADIIRPDEGTVRLFGEIARRELLDRLGYLPEERGLYRRQRVIEVLRYFGELKGLRARDATARAREWLEKLELGHVERWRVEQLSKGMSQKVQIAAVLLADPELCVLDEPFTGLDPISVQLVQRLIEERARSGKTTILSTHQMGFVETLCNRVGLVHRGKLVVYGTVESVRAEHSRPEIRVRLRGELPPLPPGVSGAEHPDGGWTLTLDANVKPHEVASALVRGGAHLEHFEVNLAPLEEVFVRVVGANPS